MDINLETVRLINNKYCKERIKEKNNRLIKYSNIFILITILIIFILILLLIYLISMYKINN